MTRLSFPPDARLDSFLIELGAAGVVSAAAALVGSAETVLAAAQWGTTQVRGGVAVTPETLFDLASLTKPFMASLALSLHAGGGPPAAPRRVPGLDPSVSSLLAASGGGGAACQRRPAQRNHRHL
jgi:hypothetical protein